jgi:chemotaxis protein CheZ
MWGFIGDGIDVQRKFFRIEQMMPGRRPSASATERRMADELTSLRAQIKSQAQTPDTMHGLKADLAAIRDTVARNKRDLGVMIADGNERRMARAAAELGAARRGMEIGAEKILRAAEVIDESARALTASLQDEYTRGLAQEIQDQVIDVFEACNFQDISGQRIGKVIATLSAIEDQVTAALARCETIADAPAAFAPRDNGLLNGPKLDGDLGHADQRDIDRMFGT